MDIRKLQRAIVDGLEDVKGQHIAVFNTEHLSSMFERVIIASGTSNRQTKALAASVRNSVRQQGMPVLATEGEDNGEWIIVDCGAAVAHIMQPAIREYYHLEEIWGGKSVRMKVGEVGTKLVKASEPERAPRKKAAQAASGKAAPVKTAARPARPHAAPAKPAASARSGGAGKPAKTDADKKMANRSAAYKRVAARPVPRTAPATTPGKAPARTASVARAPSKLAARPAAKTPAKKVSAKKAPARKTARRA